MHETTRIISFANQHPACHLATSVDGQPHVRGMLLWYADETGFYFHTASTKSLAEQIQKNPKVEIAFIKPSEDPDKMEAMRVAGTVEIMDDKKLEERLLTERPWLKEYEKYGSQIRAVIFRVINSKAFIWSMAHNLRERDIERVSI